MTRNPAKIGAATFSDCGRYRYTLRRSWTRDPRTVVATEGLPHWNKVAFLMLNPSTADEFQDDPTIRRCIGYAKRWGASELQIINLFALRATDPRRLRTVDEHSKLAVADPVGPGNTAAIRETVEAADVTICAWGRHGAYRNRAAAVLTMLREAGLEPRLRYLRLTQDGVPWHPLYLPGDLVPQTWGAP